MDNLMDYELSYVSASRMLLYRTYQESWKRGEDYVKKGKVKLLRFDQKTAEGIAYGTETYQVKLEFKSGGISRSYTCPVNDFCKHMVALAIIWDIKRGITKPTPQEIENEAIPPPLVSHADVMKAFSNPINADLDVIRIAADERGWSRPHARLPQKPRSMQEKLDYNIIKKSLTEIRSWSRRSNFDTYFCAGEMMAAFCEVIRETTKQWSGLDSSEKNKILKLLEEFENELIFEMIDDSDGLHEFSQAHLDKLRDQRGFCLCCSYPH